MLIHGLFIDGARWDKSNSTLADSEPKKLFAALPVLFVTVMAAKLLAEKRLALGGDAHLYNAPCYRYPLRNDRVRHLRGVFYVCRMRFSPFIPLMRSFKSSRYQSPPRLSRLMRGSCAVLRFCASPLN